MGDRARAFFRDLMAIRLRRGHHVAGVALCLVVTVGTLAIVAGRQNITGQKLETAWATADKGMLLLVMVASAAFHIFVGADKLWRVLRALRVDISF